MSLPVLEEKLVLALRELGVSVDDDDTPVAAREAADMIKEFEALSPQESQAPVHVFNLPTLLEAHLGRSPSSPRACRQDHTGSAATTINTPSVLSEANCFSNQDVQSSPCSIPAIPHCSMGLPRAQTGFAFEGSCLRPLEDPSDLSLSGVASIETRANAGRKASHAARGARGRTQLEGSLFTPWRASLMACMLRDTTDAIDNRLETS